MSCKSEARKLASVFLEAHNLLEVAHTRVLCSLEDHNVFSVARMTTLVGRKLISGDRRPALVVWVAHILSVDRNLKVARASLHILLPLRIAG